MSKIKALLSTPLGRKVEHLAVTFATTFGVTLAFNGKHVLDAHGLSALKSAVPALAITAALVAWQAVRGQIPAPLVAEVEAVVEKVVKKRTPKPPTA